MSNHRFLGLPLAPDVVEWWANLDALERCGAVITLPEYFARLGLSADEPLHQVLLALSGLPLLPPARGSEIARVSVAHADAWRRGFAALCKQNGIDAREEYFTRVLEDLAAGSAAQRAAASGSA